MTDISRPRHARGAIDLRKLEQFVAVAEEMHVHRAALRLGLSQPPLTVAIRKLEEEIGAPLFERGGNRMLGLTAAGATFLTEARAALAQTDRAIRVARETAAGRTGLVRLGYVGSALYGRLPDAVARFRASHPDVRLELREATTAAQVAMLRDGTLDVGVLIPPLSDADGKVLHPFDTDHLCMALPGDHPLANWAPLHLADLADEPFVLWPQTEGRGFHLRVVRLCTDAGFVPRVVQEAHGMHAVLSLVAVGAGVSVVPESMAAFWPDRIAYRPIDSPDAAFDLCLAIGGTEPAAQAFVAMAGTR